MHESSGLTQRTLFLLSTPGIYGLSFSFPLPQPYQHPPTLPTVRFTITITSNFIHGTNCALFFLSFFLSLSLSLAVFLLKRNRWLSSERKFGIEFVVEDSSSRSIPGESTGDSTWMMRWNIAGSMQMHFYFYTRRSFKHQVKRSAFLNAAAPVTRIANREMFLEISI